MDYCASPACGPCLDGEGDCDPGQCDAGLACFEEGAVDHCHAATDTCTTPPGAMDYCATSRCGPCVEGEGDCDPGQCDAGLACVEEGAVDHCRTVDSCDAAPDAMDYCAASRCGPCAESEGDCDPGQCGAGLDCAEEGGIDRCRVAAAGPSNLQVRLEGVWQGVCCDGTTPELSGRACRWTEADRTLTDTTTGLKLFCPEGSPATCTCNGSGERMHGKDGDLDSSLLLPNGGPVYPNFGEETCVFVNSAGRLATEWSSSACPSWRMDQAP